MIKRYLKHPRAFTQNELARRCKMGNSTLSEFIKGKHNGLTSEQEALIIDTIAPWERDPICVAGRILTSLYKQYFSKGEIDAIASKVGQKMQSYSAIKVLNSERVNTDRDKRKHFPPKK
jgi:transcriptional regulator with XRE-family HTH domain